MWLLADAKASLRNQKLIFKFHMIPMALLWTCFVPLACAEQRPLGDPAFRRQDQFTLLAYAKAGFRFFEQPIDINVFVSGLLSISCI